MNEPDLNLLIALDALLAQASVAGAARKLGLSESAMSRTLGRLRAVTGDPLLVRAGRIMVLTPYAETLRERSHHVLFDALTVLRPASTALDLQTLERTFVLRCNDGFVEAFGAALIAAVYAVAPRVCLRFAAKPEKSAVQLREGTVDLEIGVLGEMGPEIRLQTLFRDRFVGVVRKGHPIEQRRSVTLPEYVACGHVVASRRGTKSGPVDVALAERGMTRNIVALVPGFPAALAVVQDSDLVGLIPLTFLANKSVMRGEVREEAFYAFDLPIETDAITISQMWHPRSQVDPAHRWLRQLVLTVCREQVALLDTSLS